jgi:hypothetical protein
MVLKPIGGLDEIVRSRKITITRGCLPTRYIFVIQSKGMHSRGCVRRRHDGKICLLFKIFWLRKVDVVMGKRKVADGGHKEGTSQITRWERAHDDCTFAQDFEIASLLCLKTLSG